MVLRGRRHLSSCLAHQNRFTPPRPMGEHRALRVDRRRNQSSSHSGRRPEPEHRRSERRQAGRKCQGYVADSRCLGQDRSDRGIRDTINRSRRCGFVYRNREGGQSVALVGRFPNSLFGNRNGRSRRQAARRRARQLRRADCGVHGGQRLLPEWQAAEDSRHLQPPGPCGRGWRAARPPAVVPARRAQRDGRERCAHLTQYAYAGVG